MFAALFEWGARAELRACQKTQPSAHNFAAAKQDEAGAMYVTVSIWGEAMMAMETSSTAADTGGDGPIVCPAFRKSSWRRCAVLSALLGLLAAYVCFLGDEGAMSGNGMVSDSNGTRSTGIRGSNSRGGSTSGGSGGRKKKAEHRGG